MRHIPRIALTIFSFSVVTTSAQKLATVRQIDFDNFTYLSNDTSHDVPMNWKWLNSTPDKHFRMIDGIHHFYSAEQDSYERQHSPDSIPL